MRVASAVRRHRIRADAQARLRFAVENREDRAPGGSPLRLVAALALALVSLLAARSPGGRRRDAVSDPLRHADAVRWRLHQHHVDLRNAPRHRPTRAPRGGDLWIRYPDGTLRNLTAEAGYGTTPALQIAVRDPYPHWDGTKALFTWSSAAPRRTTYDPVYFQIYEVTGLGAGRAPSRSASSRSRADANNVTPIYASDGRILFTSDRPAQRRSAPLSAARRVRDRADRHRVSGRCSPTAPICRSSITRRRACSRPSSTLRPRRLLALGSPAARSAGRRRHLRDPRRRSAELRRAHLRQRVERRVPPRSRRATKSFPEPRELYGDPRLGRPPADRDRSHLQPVLSVDDAAGRHRARDPEPSRPPRAVRLHRARAHLPRLRRRRDRASTSSCTSPRTRRIPVPTTASAARSSARAAPGRSSRIDAPPGANADDIAVTYVTHPATASAHRRGRDARRRNTSACSAIRSCSRMERSGRRTVSEARADRETVLEPVLSASPSR